MADDPVGAQYEAYPYPSRDPAEEKTRLVPGSPSDLWELNHHVFGGRRDMTRPLSALVAGGGTGDATIMLAQQMTDAGVPGDVVHLDPSAAGRAIAEKRAAVRGLGNVRFVAGSIEAVAAVVPGPWDYIDCCGVLHHLADPDAGLAALASVLAPDGGIGLMVYGPLGRTGVYPLQALLRRLAPATLPLPTRIAMARRVVAALPATNWFRRNPHLADHLEGGDAGLVDLLLHARDRAYPVPKLAAMVAGAGLRVTSFIEPLAYDARRLIADRVLTKGLDGLDIVASATLAEQFAGTHKQHVVYLVRAGNGVTAPDPADPAVVPVIRGMTASALATALPKSGPLRGNVSGIAVLLPLPPLARAIVERCDGQRSVAAIHADIRAELRPELEFAAFSRQFVDLWAALGGVNRMVLRYR
ncbi:MAG: class I SAM-dependent methyltransferase [Alphaproteobacteria bacterium]|nr:class I SAM-dependent methyltransferase [Alphaproteobacteria bacterium]